MTSPLQHLQQSGRLKKFYIDGKWVLPSGSDKVAVINPATELEFAEIALGNDEDVALAVAAARGAFAGWARTGPADRSELLNRVHQLMQQRLELLAQASFPRRFAAPCRRRTAFRCRRRPSRGRGIRRFATTRHSLARPRQTR